MIKAIWNGKVIAESDHTEIVDGNQYFPADARCKEFFRPPCPPVDFEGRPTAVGCRLRVLEGARSMFE